MGAQSKPDISPLGRAAAGATGAVLANALVYPLDMYVCELSELNARTNFADSYPLPQRQDKIAGASTAKQDDPK